MLRKNVEEQLSLTFFGKNNNAIADRKPEESSLRVSSLPTSPPKKSAWLSGKETHRLWQNKQDEGKQNHIVQAWQRVAAL